eukprot:1487366-Pyramimonas_sp.AAC.1
MELVQNRIGFARQNIDHSDKDCIGIGTTNDTDRPTSPPCVSITGKATMLPPPKFSLTSADLSN